MSAPLPPLLLRGDCLEQLRRIPDDSVDAIVTDPPYGLDFMGKDWDNAVKLANGMLGQIAAGVTKSDRGPLARGGTHSQGYANHDGLAFEMWVTTWAAECLRILAPGGHLLAFGGSRTWHRLAAGIEDAGFELRDSIAWLYGSGFPKSLDVSKAIDKAAGAEGGRGPMKRGGERLLNQTTNGARDGNGTWGNEVGRDAYTYAPATDAAREWQGWGTALKPAFEPIVVARKPLVGTVAANVLAYGTGALNIDASRIGTEERVNAPASSLGNGVNMEGGKAQSGREATTASGRWPANVVLASSSPRTTGRSSRPASPASSASRMRTTRPPRGLRESMADH